MAPLLQAYARFARLCHKCSSKRSVTASWSQHTRPACMVWDWYAGPGVTGQWHRRPRHARYLHVRQPCEPAPRCIAISAPGGMRGALASGCNGGSGAGLERLPRNAAFRRGRDTSRRRPPSRDSGCGFAVLRRLRQWGWCIRRPETSRRMDSPATPSSLRSRRRSYQHSVAGVCVQHYGRDRNLQFADASGVPFGRRAGSACCESPRLPLHARAPTAVGRDL